MRRFHLAVVSVTGLLVAAGLYGCAPSSTPETPAAAQGGASEGEHSGEQGHPAERTGHEGHEGHGDMAKMKEGLAELSESDRAAAEKQHVCPVSGEMLGTMGAPIKLTVKDHEVWICCDGCSEKIEGDPDKYLAKLKK